MRLLLDTGTFIWAVSSPEKISDVGTEAIAPESVKAEISAISISEIAIKHAKGKLSFSKTDVFSAIERMRLRVLPYTSSHASRFFELPAHHADPFDRMIIAQALTEDLPIVTSDQKFRLYHQLNVIW